MYDNTSRFSAENFVEKSIWNEVGSICSPCGFSCTGNLKLDSIVQLISLKLVATVPIINVLLVVQMEQFTSDSILITKLTRMNIESTSISVIQFGRSTT